MTTSRINKDANGASITTLNPQLVDFNLMLAERRRKDREAFRHLNGQSHIAQMVYESQNRAYMLAQAEPTQERRDLCAAVTKSSTGAAAICGRGGVKSSQW